MCLLISGSIWEKSSENEIDPLTSSTVSSETRTNNDPGILSLIGIYESDGNFSEIYLNNWTLFEDTPSPPK